MNRVCNTACRAWSSGSGVDVESQFRLNWNGEKEFSFKSSDSYHIPAICATRKLLGQSRGGIRNLNTIHHRGTEGTEGVLFFPDREMPIGEKPLPFGRLISSLLIKVDCCLKEGIGKIPCSSPVTLVAILPRAAGLRILICQGFSWTN